MERGTLLVRADASLEIGTGHVMRCLALAQGWRASGGNVIFVCAQLTPSLKDLLQAEHIQVTQIDAPPGSREDLARTEQLARSTDVSWLAIDGYQFDTDYQATMQQCRSLLTIDDNAELDYYAADLVLNQNAHASPSLFENRSSNTRLLLGPRFALLRDEFVAYRGWSREIPQRATRLLLTMGGSDAANLTPRLLPLLADLPIEDLRIRVVMGGSARNADAVASIAAQYPGRVEVLRDVKNMAALMTWADVAVAGAGTTCWEMCSLGLPAILIVVADNQKFIARKLADLGAVENAGSAANLDAASVAESCRLLLADRTRRTLMSQIERQIVDGSGRERVLDQMKCGDAMCA